MEKFPKSKPENKEAADIMQRLRRKFFEESGSEVSLEELEEMKELTEKGTDFEKIITDLDIVDRKKRVYYGWISALPMPNEAKKEMAELQLVEKGLLQELNKLLNKDFEDLFGKKIEVKKERIVAGGIIEEAQEIKNAIDKLRSRTSKK